MKAIIEGVRYDTKTARQVFVAEGGDIGVRDVGFWQEELWETAKGNFFLVGRGGLFTKYHRWPFQKLAQPYGERIIPLENDQAFEWLEKHAPEKIEELYPDSIKDA